MQWVCVPPKDWVNDKMTVFRTLKVLVKLLPVILYLRRDRKQWSQGKNNVKVYKKHARRALSAFTTLGPVYIKLGQWLSARADILPQPYMEELAKLQDDVPAAPFDQVKPIIEKDVGVIQEVFDDFDTTPISGASLGQVYRAILDGKEVAVKVRRPRIEDVVAKDIAVLKRVLPTALAFVDPNLRFSGKAMLAQFIESIHEEMDYRLELKNLQTVRDNMMGYKNVLIPTVYKDLSTESVLVMEYLPGIKVTDIDSLDAAGIDRHRLVVDIHRVFFTMLLRYSVFHADPHPGNISITKNGRIILYDFGMVGRLDSKTRLRLIRLYLALVERDPSRTVNAMDDLGMLAPGYNRNIMEKAIQMTVEAMHGRKPDEMEVRSLLELANRTMSKFPFLLPKNLALYMRMASIIEGIYKTHKVDFRFVPVLRDILQQENLARDGYIAEIKNIIQRLVRSLDVAISLGPDIQRFLDEYKPRQNNGRLIAGSVFASVMFFGSTLIYLAGRSEGMVGMALSIIVVWFFTKKR